jgi:hypothetical protein
MNFAADLGAMLAGPFGELVTIASRPVRAIFDAAYADALGVAGSAPVLTCASADVATVARGAPVRVRGAAFTVANIQPDGTGVTVLILERA